MKVFAVVFLVALSQVNAQFPTWDSPRFGLPQQPLGGQPDFSKALEQFKNGPQYQNIQQNWAEKSEQLKQNPSKFFAEEWKQAQNDPRVEAFRNNWAEKSEQLKQNPSKFFGDEWKQVQASPQFQQLSQNWEEQRNQLKADPQAFLGQNLQQYAQQYPQMQQWAQNFQVPQRFQGLNRQ